MATQTYLWIEDRKGKAGYTFWAKLMEQICPEVIVESKKNNSELVKAVKHLKDRDNRYVIVFDNSFDNLQAVVEHKKLMHYAGGNANVILLDTICFEYILLEFRGLIDWIYAPEDVLLRKRAKAVAAREKLVTSIASGELHYKEIQEIVAYDRYIDEHNIEQLSARLLFDLTRNTGFEVSKGTIGSCWLCSCCWQSARQEGGLCGLDHARMSVLNKMKCIYEETSLQEQFSKVGLEVSL